MKNNSFVQGKLSLQKMLIPAGLCYVAYLAGLFIFEGGFDKHLNTILNAPDIFSSFGLLSQQLLKILGLIMLVRAAYKLRVDIITVIFIFFLSVSSFVNLRIFTFYMDSMGNITDFNLKSIMLLIGLSVLYIRDSGWILRVARHKVFWPLFIVVFCGLFTQTYHLGFRAGLGIAFIKVVQPMIFMVLVSYTARTKEGVRLLFGSLIISIVFFIICRLVLHSGHQDAFTGRIFGIGTWTIYGTLLTSVLPFAHCMWRKTRNQLVKILLIGSSLLIIYEVFSTQTRGAIVALPLLLAGFLLLGGRRSKLVLTVMVLALLCICIYLGKIPEYQLPGGRIISLNINKMVHTANFSSRLKRNADAIEYIVNHPITGVGLGKPTSESGLELAFWVYNPYLHWGVSMGVLAMLAFALSMFWAVVKSIKNLRYEVRALKLYQISILASLCVWMLNQFTTGDSLIYLQPLESILFFYAVIGMIIGQSIKFDMKKRGSVIMKDAG